MVERGALGVWVVGEAGAVLVEPGGRRAYCWCVRVEDGTLPFERWGSYKKLQRELAHL